MTAIQWTDVTDNPIVVKGGGWYCRKISPGCANCYAEGLNQNSFFGGNHLAYSGAAPELELKQDLLASWARMRSPKKHFVSSMTDVFGEFVPDDMIFDILDAMKAAPKQTFQVLTKRASRMSNLTRNWLKSRGMGHVPSNVWLGVSVEDQQRADERIPWLLTTPCEVRFLSCEPLLGGIDLHHMLYGNPSVSWVIVGGESGIRARDCDLDWIDSIVEQCKQAGVSVFVKQLGASPLANYDLELSDRKGGDIDEFPEALRVRQFPVVGCEV